MTAKRFVKKFLKITGIILGILVVLLVGFHFWFKAHAKQLIQDMVESKSNGKIKLKIEKFHFNYFSKKIILEKAVFYNTDTLTGTTAYHFSVDKMQLRAKAILPIVFKKQILIDSLTLLNPHIEVTRLRLADKPDKKLKKDVSIPEEMGKVYRSIQDALKVLKVKRFEINEGTFTLTNKIDPTQLPMTVSNIHFHIDNLQVDAGKLKGNEKLLFSENVVLRSTNQNIIFPDGRHRLSFSRFRINLKNKLVEFDSCTIAATKADSSSASFKVFFDALLLTNIDFDTLYKTELIKADSVYCVNPRFDLDVTVGKKRDNKKPPPKLETIIQQLTGDLQLGYVVVNNADFNIRTVKNGIPSSFIFSKNNFEMQGLNVIQNAPKPLTVKSFAMAIRNYENFIKDSSYSVKFDSVLFKDDRITLSNFLFNKLDNGKILNTFSVPQFNLIGLSWDDLVFEKKVKAEQALMFNPNISYTASDSRSKKPGRQNVFQSLGAVNEYMDLDQLDIIDGTIDLRLRNNLRIQLDNATVSVQSHSLLESKKLAGIKNSLSQLKFDKGTIHAGNVDIELHNILYIGETGQFGAASINVRNKEKDMLVDLQDISVDKMLVDELTGNVFANGARWQKGNVNIRSAGGAKDDNGSFIELNDVKGHNTSINGQFNGKSISTLLKDITFTHFEKDPANKIILDELAINGQQLKLKDDSSSLSVAEYDITDNKSSSFRQLVYKTNNEKINADVSIPSLVVIPHIQPLLDGNIALDAIAMTKPVINLHLTAQKQGSGIKNKELPDIDISELKLLQPEINFTQTTDSGKLSLNWQGNKDNSNLLQAKDLHTSNGSTSVSDLRFYLTDFVFTNLKGKTFNTGEGKVAAQLKDISFEQPVHQPLQWKAIVSGFDVSGFRMDSVGKAKGSLVMNSASLSNLNINSTAIKDLRQLVVTNSIFQIHKFSGRYNTTNSALLWHNVAFSRNNNTFSLDSFSLTPSLSIDSFLLKQLYQTDYITLRSGAVTIGPVDIDTYIKDKTLAIGAMKIDKFLFTDYKDKQLPFNSGIVKPLPVNMIKKINQLLSVDTVLLTNAAVQYTEVNEKTKQAGTIPVTRMTVTLLNIRNHKIKPGDSLTIRAVGYVLDTVWTRLRVKESYTDSLGGFLMTLRMKPGDLTVLNSALIPMASVKLLSGQLDTLDMRAVGREYLALGEMKMFYRDLKVQLLKDGDENKKTFMTKLVSFLANTFVIKTNNKSRIGNVFFLRNRDRSAINYLIKIAISGMTSSVGAKSNKKMMRRYKKELEKRNLPPINFD